MKISSAFPSKYLKASDLAGMKVTVEIGECNMEDIGDGDKPVLYFAGKGKGLVMNKTNASTISAQFGDDTGDWMGKTIKLYPAKTQFQGQTVDCIRIEHVVADAEGDGSIPF